MAGAHALELAHVGPLLADGRCLLEAVGWVGGMGAGEEGRGRGSTE